MRKLYLVRGNDSRGENQDLFVVAEDPEEGIMLWNNWCVENEFERNDEDEFDPDVIIEPENLREILETVAGTQYDTGKSGVIEWGDIPIVS